MNVKGGNVPGLLAQIAVKSGQELGGVIDGDCACTDGPGKEGVVREKAHEMVSWPNLSCELESTSSPDRVENLR